MELPDGSSNRQEPRARPAGDGAHPSSLRGSRVVLAVIVITILIPAVVALLAALTR